MKTDPISAALSRATIIPDVDPTEQNTPFEREWIVNSIQKGTRLTGLISHVPDGFRMISAVYFAVQDAIPASRYCAIVTIAVHPDRKCEVLMVETGKWTGPEMIQRLCDTHTRYKSLLVMAKNGADEFVIRNIPDIPIVQFELSVNTMKFAMDELAFEFSRGLWLLPEGEPRSFDEATLLANELLLYGGQPDTRLIALFLAREGARVTRHKGTLDKAVSFKFQEEPRGPRIQDMTPPEEFASELKRRGMEPPEEEQIDDTMNPASNPCLDDRDRLEAGIRSAKEQPLVERPSYAQYADDE